MHDFAARTEHRLTRFVDERLTPAVHRLRTPVSVRVWQVPGEPVSFAEATSHPFEPFEVGQGWAPAWGTTWFHLSGVVPESWADQDGVAVEVDVDLGFRGWGPGFTCEGQVWTMSGDLVKGIHPQNRWVQVQAGPGEPFEFYLEAAANPVIPDQNWYTPTVAGDKATRSPEPYYKLGDITLVARDLQVWELARDVEVLRGLVAVLPLVSTRRAQVLAGLADMLNAVDPCDLATTATAGRQVLAPLLDRRATQTSHVVHAVGHAHIDSAWLWPVRETIRKCVRTFGNVVDLMDHEPDLIFACSSAQQYEWVRQAQPDLFERIREYVSQGRFVPVGGMWVESDTNMPGGEAMARQFIHGTRFFMDEFGIEPGEVWLPDSFGYSGAMPQIALAAGKRSFLSQKMSWNDTNPFPHHTFWWRGIDGSRIFTHFPPSGTYNSTMTPEELACSERQFSEKARAVHALMPYGFGDGGGGPTREMLALARRQKDLEGSPKVVLGTPEEFFEQARAELTDPPTWTGEMYLEYHRGTYTSQHRTKAGNRRSEHLLREAELWWTTAAVRLGADYPAEALERLWKLVLLQQFHDILPGSSIAWVHQDAERNYEAIGRELIELIDEAMALLAGEGDRVLVFNARPFPDRGVSALGAGQARDAADVRVSQQGTGFLIASDTLEVHVSDGGVITSLLDLPAGRELVPSGQSLGGLRLHRDMPNEWDAWDINHFYREVSQALDHVESITTGDRGLRIERRTQNSRILQDLWLDEAGLHLDFEVDWHDRQCLLKLELPLDLQADQATSEIQFGHLHRPTAVNTSWDAARFETVAHRWVYVAEPGYGVAVANESTYGHDITTSTTEGGSAITLVRPSMLRAPLWPDPQADQGTHHLRYLVVPGATVAEAVQAGYRANLPLREIRGAQTVEPLVAVSDSGVVVEAVKLAEDGSGDVVVRLYESLGARTRATVSANFPVREIVRVDLLERPWGEADAEQADAVDLTVRPFELVTLRLRR